MFEAIGGLAGLGGALLRVVAQADPAAPGAAAAVAAEGAGAKSPGAGVMIEQLLIFGGIFVVFWFLVLRPQSKRQKDHTAFLSTLKVGTRVVTSSGIFGRIAAIDEKTIDLEVAPKTVIKVLRSQIAGLEGKADEAVQSATAR